MLLIKVATSVILHKLNACVAKYSPLGLVTLNLGVFKAVGVFKSKRQKQE